MLLVTFHAFVTAIALYGSCFNGSRSSISKFLLDVPSDTSTNAVC